MSKKYQTNDVYNEIDVKKRRKAERKADPKVFFNKEGNPFLGFMHFLQRIPVPPKQIDEQRLIADFADHARRRNSFNLSMLFTIMALALMPFILTSVLPFFLALRVSPVVLCIIAIAIILFFVVIKSVIKSKKKQNYNYYTVEDYKGYVVQRAIGSQVQELVYEPRFGLPMSVYKDLNVILNGNIYRTEDLITGKYHDVYFAQSDLVVQYESGNQDDNTYKLETYFKGRWIGIEYPKKFTGTVIIVENNFSYFPKRKDLERVELESIEFNRIFTVKSNDMHLVYYLLTPQFMERLMYLRQHAKGNVIACFKDGILNIFINNRQDSFEPNMRQINLMNDIQGFMYDFSLVSGLIEILKIDNNVYVQHDEETPYQQQYQNNPMPPMNNGF